MARPVRTILELGAMIRAARREQSLTQEELARRARVSRAFVIDIEGGKRAGAEIGRVFAIIRALGLAVEVVPDDQPTFQQMLDAYLRDN